MSRVTGTIGNMQACRFVAAFTAAFLIVIAGQAPVSAQPSENRSGYSWSWKSDDPARKVKAESAEAMSKGDYDKAVEVLQRASWDSPFDDSLKDMLADAFRLRGWARFARDRFEDSYNDFRRASNSEKGKKAETYLGLGITSFRLRNNDDALYYLYEAEYLDPDDWHAHDLIAGINYQRGKLEEAIDQWEAALRLAPDNKTIKASLAKARREYEVEGSFSNTDTYYFNIKYEGEAKRDLGDMVLEILSDAYRDIGGDLEYFPNEPVAVILYTQEQFSDVTDAPAWSSGIFDGNIRVPVGGRVDRELLAAVLYHEYAHAVTNMIAGRNVPTWLAEGIALHEERWVRGGSVHRDVTSIVPLARLNGPFVGMNDDQARAAYAQSLSVTQFIVDRFGGYNLAKLLKYLGDGYKISDAVRECTGISYSDFEKYWAAGLSR